MFCLSTDSIIWTFKVDAAPITLSIYERSIAEVCVCGADFFLSNTSVVVNIIWIEGPLKYVNSEIYLRVSRKKLMKPRKNEADAAVKPRTIPLSL